MKTLISKYFPDEYAESVFRIDYKKLYNQGIRGVIFDIDNTLVHHGDDSTPEIDELFRIIHSIGLKTVLLTNNDEERVRRFIKNIDTFYVCDAEKPETGGYKDALRKLSVERKEAVVIGDQMFTDILGANRCGISSILVHYIKLPEEKKIGKKRYVEKLLLFLWKHSSRCHRRFGGIDVK